MKAVAIRKVKFNCNDNLYDCEKGQEVDIKSTDLEKAKASRLFEFIKEEKVAKPRRTKKAE